MNCGISTELPRVLAPGTAGLVGLDGLEPSTSRLSGARSNHLSYKPLLCVDSFPSSFTRVMRNLIRLEFDLSMPSGMKLGVSSELPRVAGVGTADWWR